MHPALRRRPTNAFIKSLLATYIPYVNPALNEVQAETAQNDAPQTDDVSSSTELNLELYTPSGKWAWVTNLPFTETRILCLTKACDMHSRAIKISTVAGRRITYMSHCWSRNKQDNLQGFCSEIALYKSQDYLKPLQGDIIPGLIAVHADSSHLSHVFELPHQSFWIEASPDMPTVLKERCIEALHKIHTRGVLHGGLQLRNVLIGGDGRVTIQCFNQSRALIPLPDVGLKKALPQEFNMEMRKLRFMLNYGDARGREIAKMKRAQFRKSLGNNSPPKSQDSTRLVDVDLKEIRSHEDIIEPPAEFNDWGSWVKPQYPNRFVVPGQTTEEVVAAIQAFTETVRNMDVQRLQVAAPPQSSPPAREQPACSPTTEQSRKRSASPPTVESRPHKRPRTCPSSTFIPPCDSQHPPSLSDDPEPRQPLPPSGSHQTVSNAVHERHPFFQLDDYPSLTDEERESIKRHSIIREINLKRCSELGRGLLHCDRLGNIHLPPRHACALGTLRRARQDQLNPFYAQVWKETKKINYRMLKEREYAPDPEIYGESQKRIPQGPPILTTRGFQERRLLAEPRRGAQDGLRSALRNRNANPGPIDESALFARDSDSDDDEAQPSIASLCLLPRLSHCRGPKNGGWPLAVSKRGEEPSQEKLLEGQRLPPYNGSGCWLQPSLEITEDTPPDSLVASNSKEPNEQYIPVSKDIGISSSNRPAIGTLPQFTSVPGYGLVLRLWNRWIA